MKLIITDMDGTLLKPNDEIPTEYFELMHKLKPYGIKFGIASGRQYGILKNQFKNDYHDMLIISDNGAAVYNGDHLIYKHCLPNVLVHKYHDLILRYPYFGLIYAGVNSSFTESENDIVIENLKRYCHCPTKYSSLEAMLAKDDVAKLAIYDFSGQAGKHVRNFVMYHDVDFVASGDNWIDINAKDTSKGQALHYIKQQYQISSKDIYVFGDYNNDISMLKEADNSFAMANATADVN